MTEELIKEQLSNCFINILASNKGFGLTKDDLDYGVDFCLKKYITRIDSNGNKRSNNTGQYIDIQLKSTTERNIEITNDKLVYDLEVKNYNDLILRSKEDSYTPLILILFILPDNKNEWVSITQDELSLKRNAFWFYPDINDVKSENSSKKRIKIPLSNILNLDCFDKLHNKFFPNEV